MEPITLKAGVTVYQLYGGVLNEEQLQKVEKAAVDGFTEDELQQLKNDGIDTDLIRNNAANATATKAAGNKSEADVTAKADEIKQKYCSGLAAATGDKYSSGNPQLKALKQAMDDGLILELAEAGFSKAQIVSIIGTAFDSVGIKGTENGGYTLPHGHDDEAVAIFNQFKNQLVNATEGNAPELLALKEKIGQINSKITSNNYQMQLLECEISSLELDIQRNVEEAVKKSEQIAEEAKEDSVAAVNENLRKYTDSKGEMTFDEFQAALKGDLDNISGEADSELSTVILQMVVTEKKMASLNGLLGQMKNLNNQNAQLKGELDTAIQDYNNLKVECLNNDVEDSSCSRTDPIGFTAGGVRYDFFIDKDGNNDITNENEFLGAENGFKELRDLDKDAEDAEGHGILSYDELAANKDLKVVVTNADGSQEIKSAADVFKQGDSINLNSFNNLGKEMENGNMLVGTFDVNFGGNELKGAGYQTLDTLDFLDANFEFTDEAAGIGRHATDDIAPVEAKDYTAQIGVHDANYAQMVTDMNTAWANINADGDDIRQNIVAANSAEGDTKGKEIENIFIKQQETEAEAEAQAEAEQQAQNDPTKKKDKEDEIM